MWEGWGKRPEDTGKRSGDFAARLGKIRQRYKLVAAATTATASAASARWAGGFCGAAGDCGAEDRELDSGFFAGTLGAGDFLLAVDDDFFELRVAIVADVFVDGHTRFLFVNTDYSKFAVGKRGPCACVWTAETPPLRDPASGVADAGKNPIISVGSDRTCN